MVAAHVQRRILAVVILLLRTLLPSVPVIFSGVLIPRVASVCVLHHRLVIVPRSPRSSPFAVGS